MQLAALLLVGGFEFLMLHFEPLLLQHDLLVQSEGHKTQSLTTYLWSQLNPALILRLNCFILAMLSQLLTVVLCPNI